MSELTRLKQGVSAAIGNAVFHATGTRFRRLPIHIEDVLASL